MSGRGKPKTQEIDEEEKKELDPKATLERLIKLDKKHSNFDLKDSHLKYTFSNKIIIFCLNTFKINFPSLTN